MSLFCCLFIVTGAALIWRDACLVLRVLLLCCVVSVFGVRFYLVSVVMFLCCDLIWFFTSAVVWF